MKRALGNVLPHIAFFATIFMHVSDRKGGEGGMLVRTSEIFIKPSLHALNQVFLKRCKKIMKVIYKRCHHIHRNNMYNVKIYQTPFITLDYINDRSNLICICECSCAKKLLFYEKPWKEWRMLTRRKIRLIWLFSPSWVSSLASSTHLNFSPQSYPPIQIFHHKVKSQNWTKSRGCQRKKSHLYISNKN